MLTAETDSSMPPDVSLSPQPGVLRSQPAPLIVLPAQNTIVQNLLSDFLSDSISPSEMQITVRSLTKQIVTTAIANDDDLVHVTLIPILRGGLPMYAAAQALFFESGCILVRCSKTKGTEDVKVEWLGRRPFPPERGDGQIVVLDTVIATGDTLSKVCDELWEMSGEKERCITIMSCYASPEGLATVRNHPMVKGIFVGSVAETADKNGYLVPYTNGDIGDKLFGARN